MLPKLCVVCPGLDVAVGWGLTGGLEFAAGFENTPGEAGQPC